MIDETNDQRNQPVNLSREQVATILEEIAECIAENNTEPLLYLAYLIREGMYDH